MRKNTHKIATQKLEDYDALRVSSKLKEYSAETANRVFVALPEQISSFGAFVELRVEVELPKVPANREGCIELISISIDWPPSQSFALESRSINVTNFSVTRGETFVQSAVLKVSDEALSVVANIEEMESVSGPVTITLSTPSLYFMLPGHMPFQRYLFNFNLSIPVGTNKTLLFLDHSSRISLRCRKDDSEYHSLAYSVQNNRVRKITFFPHNTLKVRYYFGINDQSEFLRLATPLYASGISLLAGGLTLALVQAEFPDIAASAFALLILPPFLQLFSRKNIFYPSSDINRLTIENITMILAALIYIPLVALTLVSLIDLEQYRSPALTIDLAAGIVLIAFALVYILLISQGVFQYFTCDNCERRIWWRRRARLHLSTRRTLCQVCWESEEISSLFR